MFEEPISTILYSQMEFWQGRSGWWGNRRAESYYRCLFLYLETFALILKLQRFAYSGHGKGGVPCRTGDIKIRLNSISSKIFEISPNCSGGNDANQEEWWSRWLLIKIIFTAIERSIRTMIKEIINCDDQAPSPSKKRTALPRIRSRCLTSQTPLQSSLSTYWSNVIITNYYWWKETWSKI